MNDLAMSAHVSIILFVADCSLLLFDTFDDFLGAVSSVNREDDVLEEKAAQKEEWNRHNQKMPYLLFQQTVDGDIVGMAPACVVCKRFVTSTFAFVVACLLVVGHDEVNAFFEL